MKEFRKNQENLFVCEECGKECKTLRSFGCHISRIHNRKIYFDKWLKEENDDKCIICEKETRFLGMWGYNKFCSRKCSCIHAKTIREKTNLQRYGTIHTWQSSEFKEKSKKTRKEKYGDENYVNSEKRKETCLIKYGYTAFNDKKGRQTKKERYGDENYNNREKARETCLKNHNTIAGFFDVKKTKQTKKEKYGDENYSNREKARETCLKKYGVENPSQNLEIFNKQQKNSRVAKKFKNTKIYYRSSYELDFLEIYHPIFPDIVNAKSIKYFYENKEHYYHPDFYIPSLNLIIEIKNLWLAERDKEQIKAKEKATIANGFNYIMLIDKKYDNIMLMLEQRSSLLRDNLRGINHFHLI